MVLGSGRIRENPVPAADTAHLQNYCIALQPICDGALEHVADELLYRSSATATFAQISDEQAMVATARACHIAFYEVGIERLVGRRKMFINASRDMLLKPELLPPNSKQLVIEVLESVSGDPEVIAALRRIRSMGFKIALDDFVLTRDTAPLLDIADIVKIDMMQQFDEDATTHYKQKGLQLLATFERLRAKGFGLFQGYFYAHPETQKAVPGTRSSNHAVLLHLVSEMCKYNNNFKEIQNVIVQDAQLTFLLLRYANSAYFHYRGKIETIFQVLLALGMQQVRNIAITLLIAKNGPASKLLLSRALTRAGMCERLAKVENHKESDSSFLAGMLSMMSPLLGKPLKVFIEELSLSDDLVNAILLHEGQIGQLLRDVELFERAEIGHWTPERIELFNRIWMESQVWATETLSIINEV